MKTFIQKSFFLSSLQAGIKLGEISGYSGHQHVANTKKISEKRYHMANKSTQSQDSQRQKQYSHSKAK